MSISSEEEDNFLSPPEIFAEARNANESMLPEKSRERYLAAYENFIQWKKDKNHQSFSENVFLEYFNELANKYKPSSLWSFYSMLNSIVKTKNNVDIKTYSNLSEFLKRRSDGYVGQKSKVLSPTDVEKFLKEAPDNQYLATKVALIFGITGACRRQELCDITTKDVEAHGEVILVKINNARNKIPRSFTIQGPFCHIVKKYQSLRSNNPKSNRFFQNFQKGKCTAQPIGINKFGAMPKEIAKYLNLPEADNYTGHSFKRTSTTLRHSGWQSDTVSESFVEDPIRNDANISPEIKSSIKLEPLEPTAKKLCTEPRPSTSSDTEHSTPLQQSSVSYFNIPSLSTFTQENETNDIINTNVNQTITMPTKTIEYHFNNCTFTNCFKK